MHSHGHDEILGTAHNDHDLVVFLAASGVQDPDSILDNDLWIEWRGSPPHQWSAA
ncbi:hypothetical protein [Streptomyces sp. NPDC127036]|uniref:hypothetical protein n=1 Tax=Streptomyces sp. NPDC127036 TaxID=3347112 RepID=UPI003663A1BD